LVLFESPAIDAKGLRILQPERTESTGQYSSLTSESNLLICGFNDWQ